MIKCGVFDYGFGNIGSVARALSQFVSIKIIQTLTNSSDIGMLILPGVGRFGAAAELLNRNDEFKTSLQTLVEKEKPLIGLCLGAQLLFQGSDEDSGVPGLGILPGSIKRFSPGKLSYHQGWTSVWHKENLTMDKGAYYFSHAYHMPTANNSEIEMWFRFNEKPYPAYIKRNNIHAVQFHPEKSSLAGHKFLQTLLQNC